MGLSEEISLYERYKDEMTAYTNLLLQRSNPEYIKRFCEMRDFSEETVNRAGIFYIDNEAELLVPQYLKWLESFGIISDVNNRPIFHKRWVIPIRACDKKVINFVGYTPDADERYIYGKGAYYSRTSTLYGLENLEMAYDLGYAFVTEGITDTIRLRDLGYLNSFAMCGTHSSKEIVSLLNRCRHGIIRIPDRDAPGARAAKGWEFNRYITLNILLNYKDIDEMCKNNPKLKDLTKQYLDACVEWVKKTCHNGYKSGSEVLTMI